MSGESLAEPSAIRKASETSPQTRWLWGVLALVLALGLALRVAGSLGELWLDELWSLMVVTPMKSATQVFIGIHHDNNHYLISLWMWLLGPNREWWFYRLPSIVAGMGAAVTAIRIGLRQSRAAGMMGGLLVSLSYLAVFYSSEARGYAIACWMVLAAYDFLEVYLCHRTWQSGAGYGLAIVAGMMGTLSYISVAGALALWAAVVMLVRQGTRKSALQFVAVHAAPLAILATLWLVDVRKMRIGGGPELGVWRVLCETINYAFGMRGDFRFGGILASAVFLFVAWQIVALARNRDLRWGFFATGLILAPAALLIATGRAYLYPRYFLVQVFLLYLLIALGAGRVWNKYGIVMRWLMGGMVIVWAAANLLLSIELARIGRGHYKEALQYIAANTSSPPARIGSIQDLRSELLVGYYQKYLPATQSPELVLSGGVSRHRPEWLLSTISPYEWHDLPQRISVAPGLDYVLVKQFPSVKLSGFPAGVYRRADLMRP